MNGFIQRHGRPFVALACAFIAWIAVQVAVYLNAFVNENVDSTIVMASAGILTGMAAAYGGFAAYVKANVVDEVPDDEPEAPTVDASLPSLPEEG